MTRPRCTGKTREGRPCSRNASQGDRCLQHLPKAEEYGLEFTTETEENTMSAAPFAFDADAFQKGFNDGKASLPPRSAPYLDHRTTDRYKSAEFVTQNASTARSYWYAMGEMAGLGEAGAQR